MARARILVADDNPVLLDFARVRLSGHGYEVVTARTGTEALARAGSLPPDLVVLELMMPGLDGFATLKRLKAGPLAPVPVIVVSAIRDEDLIAQAFEAGAADYLLKPFQPAHLVASVERHLAAHLQ